MQKDLHKALLLAIAVLLIIIMCILILRDVGLAERIQEQVWVLCDPDSYVTLREGPGKKKPEFGGLLCGAEIWTDNVSRNGFLHVLELPAEETEGWISSRYIVYDRPVELNQRRVISADGRVACRKWVDGKITGWIHDGDQLTVWWMSDSWAVTSRGYIQTKYIGEVVPDDPELPGVWEGF